MRGIRVFLEDEEGASSMVVKLVLAVTITAALLIIVLQLMHLNLDTTQTATASLSNGTTNALKESMKTLSG